MNDCLKCSYTKGEPKGSRVCKKCGRVEGQPKSRPLMEVEQSRPTFASPGALIAGAEDARPGAFSAVTLPAHSRMGGSAAHRFLNCSGSTALIAGLKLENRLDDPEWTRDGTVAHALAARCLDTDADAWELVSQFPLPPDQASAVQEYIDYVRSLPGRRRVEVKLHLPDIHPAMFSTLDAVLVSAFGEVALHVVDYKHGQGVFVPVENNEQLMYYACMAIMEHPADFDDDETVRLTIVQPRSPFGEPIRSWDTMVGELKSWLYEVLLPAMRLEAQDMHLEMGEWCRFCPAKLICPAMSQAFQAFAGETNELAALSDEVLGRDYALTATVKMRIRAIEAEVYRRHMEGIEVPGSKLVYMRVDRVWKDDAPLLAYWEARAWQPPKLISPAMAEALGEDGKLFVKEWAYKPEAGYTVALADDPRAAVVAPTPEAKYGDPSKFLVDTGKLV